MKLSSLVNLQISEWKERKRNLTSESTQTPFNGSYKVRLIFPILTFIITTFTKIKDKLNGNLLIVLSFICVEIRNNKISLVLL